jgi:hypothetical protein
MTSWMKGMKKSVEIEEPQMGWRPDVLGGQM